MTEQTAYEVINAACEDLALSNQARFKAKLFSESALASPQINKTRRVIAAASVYAAALLVNEKVTQQEVVDVTGVSITPIRQTYKQILVERGFEMPEDNVAQRRRSSRVAVIKDRLSRVL